MACHNPTNPINFGLVKLKILGFFICVTFFYFLFFCISHKEEVYIYIYLMTSKCNSKMYMYIYYIYYLRGFLVKRHVFPTSFNLAAIFKGYLYLSNLQKISLFDVINKSHVIRSRSRISKTF